jgi:hypothetical protein
MSLPNSAIYVQFHPLIYILKLHIEMSISELIIKIVKVKNKLNEYPPQRLKMDTAQISNSRPSKISSNGNAKFPVTRHTDTFGISIEVLDQMDTVDRKADVTQVVFDRGPYMEEGLEGGSDSRGDSEDYNSEFPDEDEDRMPVNIPTTYGRRFSLLDGREGEVDVGLMGASQKTSE